MYTWCSFVFSHKVLRCIVQLYVSHVLAYRITYVSCTDWTVSSYLQTKYDQTMAKRRESILPNVRSDSNLFRHNLHLSPLHRTHTELDVHNHFTILPSNGQFHNSPNLRHPYWISVGNVVNNHLYFSQTSWNLIFYSTRKSNVFIHFSYFCKLNLGFFKLYYFCTGLLCTLLW